MVAGEWTGTMNLTEPHCGTDLGLLRHQGSAAGRRQLQITGTKIFISAGEHDLADNIIHLVLARIEGAPAGSGRVAVRGAEGPGQCRRLAGRAQRRQLRLDRAQDGIHGNSTCVMNYDNATGWLIGEENKGMQGMFVMMNEARLGVAVQGLAQSEVAYQTRPPMPATVCRAVR